jgi:hypothetical protein
MHSRCKDVPDRVTIAETQFLAREHRVHADATLCHRSKNVERKGFKTLGYDRLDLHSIRIVAHIMTTLVLANSGLVWARVGFISGSLVKPWGQTWGLNFWANLGWQVSGRSVAIRQS